ncbi:MAG: FAD-dependent monooxygenase, partial [Burkholderiaceae bacterium]
MSHAHAAYVAIIGGGPSGLMAAEALALAGVPVT